MESLFKGGNLFAFCYLHSREVTFLILFFILFQDIISLTPLSAWFGLELFIFIYLIFFFRNTLVRNVFMMVIIETGFLATALWWMPNTEFMKSYWMNQVMLKMMRIPIKRLHFLFVNLFAFTFYINIPLRFF